MAKIIHLQEAIRKNEYEEFTRLLNSSIHCVKRCDPKSFPYLKAILDIVKESPQLQQGMLALLQNFKIAVEENMKTKMQFKNDEK